MEEKMENEDKILDALKDAKASIESNVNQRFDAVDQRMDDVDTRLKEVERISAPGGVSLPGVTDEKEEFSFLKAINGIRTGDWSNAGFEKEIFDNTKTVMTVGTDSQGGYIVPNEYIAQLIELLRAESVVMRAGATVLGNLTGSPVEFPRQEGGATAYWVGENEDITESNQTLGQIALTPKACSALVKLSNRLLSMSNPDAEAMVRRDIAQVIALKIDLAALAGVGTATEPRGIKWW
jgi:HK97 family phage major capsid protein